MTDLNVIVTDFGTVYVSESTLAAMDARFPGWRDPPIKGRTRAIRNYNANAKMGERLLFEATTAIAKLAWVANQDLEQV